MIFLYKNKFLVKVKEIKTEFDNITWSNKKELSQTSLMVVILIILVCVALWIIDSTLIYIVTKLI